MVRTRANNAAVRKAVVAKAPRKNIAAGRSTGISPAGGSGSGKKKSKVGNCGHSLKLWPVPKGQKGLQDFFGGSSGNDIAGPSIEGAGPSNDGAGPSNNTVCEEWDRIESVPGSSSHEEEQVEEGGSETQETGSSSHETGSSVQLLDEDIAQLNSDDDSDED